jgi:hypothetical protein
MTSFDTTPAPAPAALSPELAALAAEAAALETTTAPPDPNAPPAEAPVDYLTDAKGIVDMASEALGAFYPSTLAVLVPEKRERIAGALAPVMQKYGFTLGVIFGRWGEEIALAFALAQVAIPITTAIRKDQAEAKKEKGELPPNPAGALQPVIDKSAPNSLHHKA